MVRKEKIDVLILEYPGSEKMELILFLDPIEAHFATF